MGRFGAQDALLSPDRALLAQVGAQSAQAGLEQASSAYLVQNVHVKSARNKVPFASPESGHHFGYPWLVLCCLASYAVCFTFPCVFMISNNDESLAQQGEQIWLCRFGQRCGFSAQNCRPLGAKNAPRIWARFLLPLLDAGPFSRPDSGLKNEPAFLGNFAWPAGRGTRPTAEVQPQARLSF